MSMQSITRADDGSVRDPTGMSAWQQWVSATRTRNHVLGNPLLDWLDAHGESKGFTRDQICGFTDHLGHVMKAGNKFEDAAIAHLCSTVDEVVDIRSEHPSDRPSQDIDCAVATWRAMQQGAAIICQGVLRDPENCTYGMPDLLVRSDVLKTLFFDSLSESESNISAPDLGIGDRHYVVVDIKFMTLSLLTNEGLDNSNSNLAYKVQLHIYNTALSRLQGYCPSATYILGRGWQQRCDGQLVRGDNCMDRLAPIGHNETIGERTLAERAEHAAAWLRRMRRNGGVWKALPAASVPELRPNAAADAGRWSGAVNEIVDATKDLTKLWNVGVDKRDQANAKGLRSWTDPRVTPAELGIGSGATAAKLQALLDINRSQPPSPRPVADLTAISPRAVTAAGSQWHREAPLEFFVDFETVNDTNDDFSKIPIKGGQTLIFMIGCGHIENNAWQFECFIATDLTERAEAVVIEDWLNHMQVVRNRIAPDLDPKVIHWGHAEPTFFERAYNAATVRHSPRSQVWPSPNWFDLLKEVVRAQPVVVRGAHDFGLKSMTNAMNRAGLIDVSWSDGPTDGLGAMVAAWTCQQRLQQGEARCLASLDLMQQVRDYNATDCDAIHEILRHLREHHQPER